MMINELLLDDGLKVYGEPYFFFWTQTVIDALPLLGPQTDSELQRLCQLLLNYYEGVGVKPEMVQNVRQEIVRLKPGNTA